MYSLLFQFVVTNVFTILIPLWGVIGIRTNRIGYVRFFSNYTGVLRVTACLEGTTMLGSFGSLIPPFGH